MLFLLLSFSLGFYCFLAVYMTTFVSFVLDTTVVGDVLNSTHLCLSGAASFVQSLAEVIKLVLQLFDLLLSL